MIRIILTILFLYYYINNILNYGNESCKNIAHGCGTIDCIKYSNSIEAFNNSYKKGFRLFEIDLLITYDGHIVGAHDWNMFKKYTRIQQQ